MTTHRTARAASVAAALTVGIAVAGCSLFQELQSADSSTPATDGSSGGSDGSGSGSGSGSGGAEAHACVIASDDRCENQDTLRSCDPSTGEATVYSCTDVCGGNLNFSCLLASTEGQHACWCVVPGAGKQLSCTGLEDCLRACEASQSAPAGCADTCFSRTNAETIRSYGALVFCANEYCDTACHEDQAACGDCVAEAIQFGGGDCTLERALCDQDDGTDDPWWPTG